MPSPSTVKIGNEARTRVRYSKLTVQYTFTDLPDINIGVLAGKLLIILEHLLDLPHGRSGGVCLRQIRVEVLRQGRIIRMHQQDARLAARPCFLRKKRRKALSSPPDP